MENNSKLKSIEKELIYQKIKIGELALKVREALWDDHPSRIEESQKRYNFTTEDLYDAMSEYDDIKDRYIIAGGKK